MGTVANKIFLVLGLAHLKIRSQILNIIQKPIHLVKEELININEGTNLNCPSSWKQSMI